MTTYNLQIAASADDAIETTDDSWFAANGAYPSLMATAHDFRTWHRWAGITEAKGTTVQNSYFSVCANGALTGGHIVTINGLLELNVGAFTTHNVSNAFAITTASYAWTIPATSTGNWASTPSGSLDTIIAEIMNQASWTNSSRYIGLRVDTTNRNHQENIFSWDSTGNVKGSKIYFETVAAGWTHIAYCNGAAVATIEKSNESLVASIAKLNGAAV
jgi:hypothetical protein